MAKDYTYKGTMSGYVNSYDDFKQYLTDRNVDTNRYRPIGANITTGNKFPIVIDIICIDLEDNESKEETFVSISFVNDDSVDTFMNTFGRANINFAHQDYDISSIEITDRIIVD